MWTVWDFLKIDFYLTKVLLKIPKKDIKRKESQRSNPENSLPEEGPKDMSLYESFAFSEGSIGIAKIAFFLEKQYYGRIFLTKFGGTFLAGFFPGFFFFRSRRKTRRNSVSDNASKIRRNTSLQECWKNEAKRRQSQTCS